MSAFGGQIENTDAICNERYAIEAFCYCDPYVSSRKAANMRLR